MSRYLPRSRPQSRTKHTGRVSQTVRLRLFFFFRCPVSMVGKWGGMYRFTQPENIAVKDWTCQKCGKVSQEANKRLSIKRLPPVLSIQFKVSSSFPSVIICFLNDEFDRSDSNSAEQKHTRSTLPCAFPYQSTWHGTQLQPSMAAAARKFFRTEPNTYS
jgi:hypothetical protein